MRGRKPTPTVLRVLRGNPGRRPINQEEPIPDALSTDAPEEFAALTVNEGEVPEQWIERENARRAAARGEWLRTIVPAIDRGQVTAADRSLAVAHCDLWALWREQLAEAARHPNIVAVGPNKHPMPNPVRGMANKTFTLLSKTDAELGLTPVSRSRVTVKKGGRQMSAIEKFKAEKARRA